MIHVLRIFIDKRVLPGPPSLNDIRLSPAGSSNSDLMENNYDWKLIINRGHDIHNLISENIAGRRLNFGKVGSGLRFNITEDELAMLILTYAN